MEKSAPSDHELLSQWLGEHREAAFHTLVERYTALVHATARRTCGDESMAMEASQLTFITLAGKASSLLSCASLGGWLHATSMMHAKNLLRKSQREDRKRQNLQLAMDTTPTDPTSQSVWKEMQPMLDEALAALPAKDREALLLRFYRSLSIREIAATLGIATAAAQKRVDRATERLRSHLSRRGCQAGGTLSAAMLTGFAADSQAALPASSILASKALAASAATAGAGSIATLTTLLTATAMKTTSFVPPLVALLAAVTWIGAQRRSLASVESESSRLRQQLADHSLAISSPASGTRADSNNSSLPTDWKELAALLDDPFILRQFQRKVEKMPPEELVSSLREIATVGLLQSERLRLEDMLSNRLISTHPEAALTHFPELIGDPGPLGRSLPGALGAWMTKEPAEASAWLDAQIAAGKLDSRRLDGNNGTRTAFEANALTALLRSSPAAAAAAATRLQALTDEDRAETMRHAGTLSTLASPETFAALAREQLTESEAQAAIAAQAENRAMSNDYQYVTKYLDAIAATPGERAESARKAVERGIIGVLTQRKFVADDIRVIREWVSAQSPGLIGELTGKALATVSIQQEQMPYPEILALVSRYHEAGDGEPLLISFLDGTWPKDEADKTRCRELAEKITDETRRTEMLERFQ